LYIQQLMNSSLSSALTSWIKFTRKSVKNRNLLERFARKWRHGTIVRSLNSWTELVKTRKFLRQFIHKLLKSGTEFKRQKFFRRWLVLTFKENNKDVNQQNESLQNRLLLSMEREEEVSEVEASQPLPKLIFFIPPVSLGAAKRPARPAPGTNRPHPIYSKFLSIPAAKNRPRCRIENGFSVEKQASLHRVHLLELIHVTIQIPPQDHATVSERASERAKRAL